MNRWFCIGNGESRKPLNLDSLREYGKIVGCNALYRHFTPDVLISVDHEISHEVYRSGYCKENITYMKNWNRMPEQSYELLTDLNLISETNQKNYIDESEKFDRKEFAIHGINIDQMKKIKTAVVEKNPDSPKQYLDLLLSRGGLWITWLEEIDKASSTIDALGGSDYGFSSGPLSSLIATYKYEADEIYFLGHDLYSEDEYVNNIYKNTNLYLVDKATAVYCGNWIQQHKLVFDKFPQTQFYKVNPNTDSKISQPIEEWSECSNVHYTNYNDLNKKFKNIVYDE
jgi:hypothetical protein